MVKGKKAIWTGLAVACFAATGLKVNSQDAAKTTQTGTAQSVPDAPRPQTLPRLNSITPVGPALPNAPGASSSSEQEKAPPSSLPSTPKPTAEGQEQTDAPDLPPPGEGAQAFRLKAVQVNYVDIPVTVKDTKGQLVPGLTNRDFRIYENGLRQQMAFWSVDPIPLSVALLIDQSVTFDTMTKINNALSALQGAFAPYDEVAVLTYNNGVRVQTTFTAAQSARLGFVLEHSKAVGREPNMAFGSALDQTLIKNNQIVDPNTTPVRGQTSIYQNPGKEYHTLNDAILAAAEETAKVGPGRRRVVYVISDGKEYGSKATQKEVIQYLQRNNVAVYATLVGDSSIPGVGFLDRIHLPLTMRNDALPRYAAMTGGQCDPEFRQRGIEQSFARITEQVRTQYTIGYYSHEPLMDGKYRSVDVRVAKPDLTVIAKPGYYPSARSTRPASVTPTAVP